MTGNDYIEIAVDYLHHTAHAVLVRDADDEEIWLPFSTIRYDGNFLSLERGEAIELEVQEWIAEKQGLT